MKQFPPWLWMALLFSVQTPAPCHGASESRAVLTEKRIFLGGPGAREWRDFDQEKPDDTTLSLTFTSHANSEEATLLIQQRDVKLRWMVLLNGRKLGPLELNEVFLETAIAVPANTLREGENVLSVVPEGEGDDIMIGRVCLESRPVQEALGESTLQLSGVDLGSGRPLPCRFTLVDAAGALAPCLPKKGQALAVRTGVIYTGDGKAVITVPAGEYSVYLTRGFEYGMDSRRVSARAGGEEAVELKIRREVPTPGLVACDTHVHTFTFSKHGDASIDERMLTIAGEGIELPVSTDHNVYVDYGEAMQRMKVQPYFTPVLGCEVTTATGHFSAFPIANAQAPLPDTKLSDWTALMRSIRSVPGVQAIVLNHPRDMHDGYVPFAPENFNAGSGDNLRGAEFSFDAIEVANSGTLQSDLSRSWRDWFALLDHGYKTVAVGSSDSHDVSRFIVGQGRTYIACDDHEPGAIDAGQAVKNFKAGHAYVSLGLLARLSVEGKFAAGDVATVPGPEVHVKVQVLGPSWSRAEKVALYANGELVREESITRPDAAGEKGTYEWTLPKPHHDQYLVAIATGPGVREPYWNIPFPYQPTNRRRNPQVMGLSNAVWLDADGDGQYSSPRAQAEALLKSAGTAPEQLLPALNDYDEAVARQAAALCPAASAGASFQAGLRTAPRKVQRGFDAVLDPSR